MKSSFISTLAVIALLMLLFIKPVKNILNFDDQVKSGMVLTANQVQQSMADSKEQICTAQNTAVIKNHDLTANGNQFVQDNFNTGVTGKEAGLVPRFNASIAKCNSNNHHIIAFVDNKTIHGYFQPGGL